MTLQERSPSRVARSLIGLIIISKKYNRLHITREHKRLMLEHGSDTGGLSCTISKQMR